MFYEIPKGEKRDLLDDSNVKEILKDIDKLLGRKLNLNIKTESEIYKFLNEPETFIEDKDIIKEINDLRELIIEMGNVYYPR